MKNDKHTETVQAVIFDRMNWLYGNKDLTIFKNATTDEYAVGHKKQDILLVNGKMSPEHKQAASYDVAAMFTKNAQIEEMTVTQAEMKSALTAAKGNNFMIPEDLKKVGKTVFAAKKAEVAKPQ